MVYEFNTNLTPNISKYIKVYTSIYKYIQDIQNIYKIPGGGKAAAARPGPEAPGPDRDPRLGAGPGRRLAAAWYYILYIFVYICIYFDIFGIKLVSNWYSINHVVFEFELVFNWH